MSSSDFLVGLAFGLVVAAGAYAVLRWRFERAVAGRARTALRGRPEGPLRLPPPTDPVVAAVPPVPPAVAKAPDLQGGDPGERRPEVAAAMLASPSPPRLTSRSLEVEEEPTLRLSQRVLLHLLRNGSASAAGEAVTQRGIMAALNASQGALSSVLRRLEDGGAIASEKAHVGGRDRRVKVYTLTPRGRSLVAAGPRTPETSGGPGRSSSPGPNSLPTP